MADNKKPEHPFSTDPLCFEAAAVERIALAGH